MRHKTLKLFLLACVALLMLCGRDFMPIARSVWSSYKSGREWERNVDQRDMQQVRDYCRKYGYNDRYYVEVDFSVPSGRKRFTIYDLRTGRQAYASYCMHGSGEGNTEAVPRFSNVPGSKCSSLGRYLITGHGTSKRLGRYLALRGLDRTNYNAARRGIYIHSARVVSRFRGETDYLPLGTASEGCFTVTGNCVTRMFDLYAEGGRPIMLYAKYEANAQ